jgi:hypothetical protein
MSQFGPFARRARIQAVSLRCSRLGRLAVYLKTSELKQCARVRGGSIRRTFDACVKDRTVVVVTHGGNRSSFIEMTRGQLAPSSLTLRWWGTVGLAQALNLAAPFVAEQQD